MFLLQWVYMGTILLAEQGLFLVVIIDVIETLYIEYTMIM